MAPQDTLQLVWLIKHGAEQRVVLVQLFYLNKRKLANIHVYIGLPEFPWVISSFPSPDVKIHLIDPHLKVVTIGYQIHIY